MGRLVWQRLAQAVPLLLAVSLVVFALLHAVPGGPLAAYLENPNVRPEDLARLSAALGLDRPLPEQYARWLGGFVRGDWGYSLADGRPVAARLFERIPATLELVAVSTVLALALALPLGLRMATSPRAARLGTPLVIAGISLPVFWLALVLQLVFGVALRWLPISGRMSFGADALSDRLAHLVLPAVVLAVANASAWSRYLQRAASDLLGEPWLLAARARGIPEWQLRWRHLLPPALGPFVTVVLLDVAVLMGGAVVTEGVFAWPGVGSLFVEALARRDYPVLMAFVMAGATVVVIGNLAADLAIATLDPRTRTLAAPARSTS